ncbi:MAG TPA: short chain dehydrogenase [Candidatus Aquilonibacter sp.]|nr:short chain dehydrogenase [Candidatus Aquilonibacter sp.]
MKILVIGATGTIGAHVVKALRAHHQIVEASRNAGVRVDIDDPASIKKMYREVGPVDAVVVAAGGGAFRPLAELSESDFEYSLRSKLMGQVNVVRFGLQNVADGGSFTLTSGVLAQDPMPGSAAISLINSGVEGFARAAALELQSRKIRVNVVSPGWISETLSAMGQDPANGIPAADVANAYVEAVEGTASGTVISAKK